MKKYLFVLLSFAIVSKASAQNDTATVKDVFLQEISKDICKCIDSISTTNKTKQEITKQINSCIDKKALPYQMASKISNIEDLKKTAPEKDGKKQIDIVIDTNKNSDHYKKYYYEIERKLMEDCPALKSKLATNDKENDNSFSKNPEALSLYKKGLAESAKENYTSAIQYYKDAIKVDAKFAFAFDNMGLAYRKMGDFDKSIEAYEQSLLLDPRGAMPLQNIAVAYQYKKDYVKAINYYERLSLLDSTNPEIYFGIGQICVLYLKDYEKGLNNLCKAYNIYTEQKSAYRTDAEKIINYTYTEMKKLGNEQKFIDILKENKINAN